MKFSKIFQDCYISLASFEMSLGSSLFLYCHVICRYYTLFAFYRVKEHCYSEYSDDFIVLLAVLPFPELRDLRMSDPSM
jgi:hypothetical protein